MTWSDIETWNQSYLWAHVVFLGVKTVCSIITRPSDHLRGTCFLFFYSSARVWFCFDFCICEVYRLLLLLNWMTEIILTDCKLSRFLFPSFSVSTIPSFSFPCVFPSTFFLFLLLFSSILLQCYKKWEAMLYTTLGEREAWHRSQVEPESACLAKPSFGAGLRQQAQRGVVLHQPHRKESLYSSWRRRVNRMGGSEEFEYILVVHNAMLAEQDKMNYIIETDQSKYKRCPYRRMWLKIHFSFLKCYIQQNKETANQIITRRKETSLPVLKERFHSRDKV